MSLRHVSKVVLALSFLFATVLLAYGEPGSGSLEDMRADADKRMGDGNYNEALEIYKKLALDRNDNADKVGYDLERAISCLSTLNRVNEIDEFMEKVIAVHKDNWQLLHAAARSYFYGNHYGYIVAGEFHRGHHRGGGRYVNSIERDRTRALQLMQQAQPLLPVDNKGDSGAAVKPVEGANRGDLYNFYYNFAHFVLGNRGYSESWRLQYLTDLSQLPDYDEGYYYGSTSRGAPVDEDGNPVFHEVPAAYGKAGSDGERWRWLLKQAVTVHPEMEGYILQEYAGFLYQQFGVQTLSWYGGYFRPGPVQEGDEEQTGTFALHTLGENETIARLANGVKRFTLPDDANFIILYKKLALDSHSAYRNNAARTLGQLFENRRQFDKAVTWWELVHDTYRIKQITRNWGQFEMTGTHPAGTKATLEYRFRNGARVTFTAQRIKVAKLLGDVKRYLRSDPTHLDWDRVNISQIGYRLVEKNRKRYVDKEKTKWDLKLNPLPRHFDRLVTVETPLTDPGAWLVEAQMEDGNRCFVVVWVSDTVIVRKPLDQQAYVLVADAVTGKPVADARVEFFGYRQEWVGDKYASKRQYKVYTKTFKEKADGNGQIVLKERQFDTRHNWMIVATNKAGRLAYMGFTYAWYGHRYDQEYNQRKTFGITDRPVYRPKQAAKFKFWIRYAKYDQDDKSAFAGQNFNVIITNPKGEKVHEQNYKADDWGGIDGEWFVPDGAALGQYYVNVNYYGGMAFRVEEYKKPEFEVKVDAPSEPVMLGEKITATIKAKYYFGAAVTQGKVKYKVLRTSQDTRWYPGSLWDWFYGNGYWWFAYDYSWWPGWHHWGCRRPVWWWWSTPSQQPELVAENEVPIGPDGTVKVTIDTSMALEFHPDTDHRYQITAEVVDQSRRTIVGSGSVLVAREPFKTYAWVDRGHYRVGDVVQASFQAQTPDSKPVQGKGELTLFAVSYDADMKPVEKAVQSWNLDTDERGTAEQQLKASRPGQYRLSYKVTDSKGHTREGGYVFIVRGEGFDGDEFRFNEIELVPDRKEYAPGEKVQLVINTERSGSTVFLFLRPTNGTYLPPEVLHLDGKSTKYQVTVTKKDMPNFFLEAVTISNGKVYSDVREIIVPPEKRVLNIEVLASKEKYKPGEKAKVSLKLTDFHGEPFAGSMVMAVYDKSVEYISGGSNIGQIRPFFWKWRRSHRPTIQSSLDRYFYNIVKSGEEGMSFLGVFGHLIADQFSDADKSGLQSLAGDSGMRGGGGPGRGRNRGKMRSASRMLSSDAAAAPVSRMMKKSEAPAEEARYDFSDDGVEGEPAQPPLAVPQVRTKFADTAYWNASIVTDKQGMAEVEFTMPENLTGWKIRTWGMGHGTRVGDADAEVVTVKNLLLRMQAPRFFVETDEVVLSANIHNYLDSRKTVKAVLEFDGESLEPLEETVKTVEVDAQGEARVDWLVKVVREGEAVVRMKALTDEESDAMEMKFPVFVHGILKTESFSGVIRPEQTLGKVEFTVPGERRVDQSVIEVRYSPTLAGAMVDALPYLVEYPYGCTEQTLNRFLPTVITQKVLKDMGLNLKDIQQKRTNLNAQEIGDDVERAKQWKRWDRNPVFDEDKVNDMVKTGVRKLTNMQLSNGGWGWFSGWGEYSYPHTTAYVVHGLQTAVQNGVKVSPNVIARGVSWLENHQAGEVRKLKNAPKEIRPYKTSADNLDAFVYMVLADAGKENKEMREFLYRDRLNLAIYGMSMAGLAFHKQGHKDKVDMIVRNIDQYLVMDKENQTAYLNLGNGGYWWYWYGSEYEAQAFYLKLLAATQPKSDKAAWLVKYLLNNRKHATYWNSTRDTAVCLEAFADFIRASGEDKPDMTVEVVLDGQVRKTVKIDSSNLFTFDNQFLLEGSAVESGKHVVELRKKGTGPIYFNAYVTNFTLEDFITKAGLEIKVERKYYRLVREDKTVKVSGFRGQALDQKVEKYRREELENLDTLKSGDLVEIELTIESKNDYEYIIFEDMKAAGFEPVEVRSGYSANGLGAYMELRDEKVALFVRWLARGKHSMAYRMRAEIPGKFSALPTKAYAMYAPELKANSDEIKLRVED